MKLSTVFELEEKISAARYELENLKSLATATTRQMDGLPRSTSTTSRVESLAVKIMDCERRLDGLVAEKICAQVDLTIEITKRVRGMAGKVLYERYVECKTFKAIIAEMKYYSDASIYHFHRNGVKQFESADKDS